MTNSPFTISIFCVFVFISSFALVSSTNNLFSQDKAEEVKERKISYAHDVRPILRRNCYRCHGAKNKEGSLQLHIRKSAYGKADSAEQIIVKNDARKSLLIKRLTNKDHGDIMPIDGQPLSAKEIHILKAWINQGADWPDEFSDGTHWAYQPIKRPQVPQLGATTTIDQFILRRLHQNRLQPSRREDRTRLIRRVSLALTGLPPTREELHDFLSDKSNNAYEKVVDRLLASPRYGERWAVPWLDLARYADSNGFQADQIRDNWAYRDWVVRAFNNDMPFDQFVIDQLAGDLRPSATIDQRIATGFNRMTTCNVEAGVHPEANRTNQVVDRVNTMATVFLGTTMECAQCHDHKYDPFTQKDYYRLFAYFNNTPLEVKNTSGVTWDFYGPKMELPLDERQKVRLDDLKTKLAELEKQRDQITGTTDGQFEEWLTNVRQLDLTSSEKWITAKPSKFESSAGEDFEIQADGAVLLTGSVPDTVDHIFTFESPDQPITAIRVDVLTDEAIPGKGPGRGDAVRSNIILSEVTFELIINGKPQTVELQNAMADFSQSRWDVARAIDGDRKTGWAIAPQFGKPHWASFTFSKPVQLKNPEDQIRVTLGQYYGRGRVIGKPRISFSSIDQRVLTLDEASINLLKKKKLNAKQQQKLRTVFEKENPRVNSVKQAIEKIRKQIDQTKPDTTLVMVEMEKQRETFVFSRGEYDRPLDKVSADFPGVLPKDETIKPTGNRLELAYQLTSRKNPLLSRVTVNRWWSELFGSGLVSTLEDFGTQAEDPSHPQLLDWLAVELMESGWSMKHIHKLIVMSSTFQQSARVTPKVWQIDPENRLLARGPRFRLSAEFVRDNALAVSGLLSEKMYGPPIMPFQPDNLWRSIGRNQPKWKAADDENRFRRGLYVVWKRAAPYPSFINFDAPDRGSCTVGRSRSNTPLQALTLLNDPAYAEMSLALADRILHESTGKSDEERMQFAMETVVMRKASDLELRLLINLLNHERESVAMDPKSVAARTKVPTSAIKIRSKDKQELAAWFSVANTLLNLDETISQ